jgi:hypothetical protein
MCYSSCCALISSTHELGQLGSAISLQLVTASGFGEWVFGNWQAVAFVEMVRDITAPVCQLALLWCS